MVAGCKGVSSPLRMSESWQTHPHTHVTEEFGGERKSEKTITEQTNFVIFFNYINFQGRAQKNAHGKTGYRLLYGRKRVWSRFHQSRTCTELYVYNTTHSHTHSKWFPDFDFGIVCDVQHFDIINSTIWCSPNKYNRKHRTARSLFFGPDFIINL